MNTEIPYEDTYNISKLPGVPLNILRTEVFSFQINELKSEHEKLAKRIEQSACSKEQEILLIANSFSKKGDKFP